MNLKSSTSPVLISGADGQTGYATARALSNLNVNITPFVYLKYRSVKNRFVDRVHTNTKATIAEATDVLSNDEINKIHRFCARIGMDYGEIDVLRDSDDGRIYIVDANNQPSGPTSSISESEGKVAIMRLSRAFEEAFGV